VLFPGRVGGVPGTPQKKEKRINFYHTLSEIV
jgi:hypothetical protein